jgi:hypothetical protein
MGNAPSGTSVNGVVLQANYNGTPLLAVDTGGNLGIAGTLSTGSLRSLKQGIAPISKDPLALIEATNWVEFNYIAEEGAELERKHLGFIAEDTDPYLSGPDHQHGYEPGSIAALACAAIKDIAARLKAANVAGF